MYSVSILLLLAGMLPVLAGEHAPTHSIYLSAQDGTRLAADVYLPENHRPEERRPALLEITRYLRSTIRADGSPGSGLDGLDRFFLANGYALVKLDARGSGASFGTRPIEYGPQEVADGWAIVDWIAGQPWCDGNVGAYGTSYSGTTAELLAACGHPALKAVIPGWSDFDVYRSPGRPYGLTPVFLRIWGNMVAMMDRNDPTLGVSVRPVDEDRDGAMLAAALAEHKTNPDVFQMVQASDFIDAGPTGGPTWLQCTPIHWQRQIQAASVPMLVLASWLDAGTAAGALARLRLFDTPQKIVILASSHGGGALASPYQVGDKPRPPVPSQAEQYDWRLRFFDHYLRGAANGVLQWPTVRYYNMGEEVFHDCNQWPPRGSRTTNFFLAANRRLTADFGDLTAGEDVYAVDFSAGTGPANRWMTQMGRPVLHLDNRAQADEKLLTYTTEPLAEDLQITGAPMIQVRLVSSHADIALLAYLEDVDAEGRVRYLTEGGLRAIHRRISPGPNHPYDAPFHSFLKADAQPLIPGEVAVFSFRLWPTSVLVRKGHRLRIALAGADADSFLRVPATGEPTFRIIRNGKGFSQLVLPTIE